MPDSNSTDFLVRSILKAKVSSIAHPSVDALKTYLLREWVKIPRKRCVPRSVISDKELTS